jgi:amidase
VAPLVPTLLAVILLAAGSITETALGQTISLADATVVDINAAFDAGTLSAESLVRQYLARIEAYDNQFNAVLWLNANAIERARELDRERQSSGPRSPMHGVPVVLKDNVDTHDMPTTAGSVLLAGSIPPDDAFIVRKLRDAGAVILAKLNMSEFASGVAGSSLGGPMRNPHDLARTPAGSSGGTGIAISASYGQVGIGTDTGGSIRGPTTVNGIVGLKPTHGLLSRDGIIPLALSFDVPGPMGRHVYDVAAMLTVMTGVDQADDATGKSEGHIAADYTAALDAAALSGARIGIARDFLGQDREVDWIVEASRDAMRRAGATVVDVRFPEWFHESRSEWYTTIRWREFRAQIPDYLATLQPEYPKTLAELVERAFRITSPTDSAAPNPGRWALMMREDESGSTSDPEYRAVHEHATALVRAMIEEKMDAMELDAIVYPTRPRRPSLIAGGGSGGSGPSPISMANLSGFPDLSIPAGFTSDGLPVGISFLGRAFSEVRLLGLGYSFEQATKARRSPLSTPPLAGEGIVR